MTSQPARIPDRISIGEDFELDLRAYELRRSGRVLKLERIPMELLRLFVERHGELITRDEIVSRIWGKDVFLDADNSINAAIRKIRQVLRDDPERPRFIQTITGKGYRFIATVAPSTPQVSADGPSQSKAAHEGLIGRKVSHYRVLQVLGGGGTGVVYTAEDLKLGRRVALKFLCADSVSDPAALHRLQHEARAASALDHPNVCAIYELGEHEGRPFIAMQHLDGETLREWIAKATALPPALRLRQMLNLGIQICGGLEAAHARGIIHRDIKPANIMVSPLGEARILDFGIAKLLKPNNSTSTTSADASGLPKGPDGPDGPGTEPTSTLASLGTPSYLSPEQIRGERLDARTDLFSFGLVLYEMATGQRAFPGNTPALIQEAVLSGQAVPPRQLQPNIPRALERIISKAMEKDRNLRYQSAAEIRGDLEALAAGQSAKDLVQWKMLVGPGSRRFMKWGLIAAGIALLATLTSGALYYRWTRSVALTEKDTIVLADFANSTADPVFDQSLKQGLSVSLAQSPFLQILPDDKVSTTLKLMTRDPEAALTPPLAREVCQRSGSKAYISGAIAALGNEYVLGLTAENCRSGDILAREQVTAESKEQVIAALGKAATRLRGRLGESLASVRSSAVPLEQATTPSLEALKAFSLAYAEANHGKYLQAIPLYKRAIELDPDFAVAYAHLGQAYANSSQGALAVSSIKQAFQRRKRASELERFYIETRYYELVTEEVQKRIDALHLWEHMYPRDPIPRNDLAAEYNDMGRFDNALAEAQETLRLAPNEHTSYEVLGMSNMGLNRFADAKAVRQKEVDLKLDYHWDHLDLYGMAFLENDAAAMQREAAWFKGNAFEFFLLEAQAGDAASLGKMRDARDLYRQAIDGARRAGFPNQVTNMTIDRDLMELLIGNTRPLSDATRTAVSQHRSQTARIAAGRAYAMSGNPAQAEAIAASLVRASPAATYVNNVWVPTLRAEAEISRGKPEKAIELLQSAVPYEFGWKALNWPNYVRARAYLQAGRAQEAAAEFQKILDHRGICIAETLQPLVCSMAQLGLARARARAGDIAGARSAYQDFLTQWKAADSDLPVLKQAKAEIQKLH